MRDEQPHGAVIIDEYRYVLWRTVAVPEEKLAGRVLWIMLNPSTATATENDATVRKVMGFSRRWGFSQARIVNLYALRSRDPEALWKHPSPVGPENDEYIGDELTKADAVVLAWGRNAGQLRAEEVRKAVRLTVEHQPVWHLGLTGNGHPKHPLMLGYDTIRSDADGVVQVGDDSSTRREGE